jgi:hypothetical protein
MPARTDRQQPYFSYCIALTIGIARTGSHSPEVTIVVATSPCSESVAECGTAFVSPRTIRTFGSFQNSYYLATITLNASSKATDP